MSITLPTLTARDGLLSSFADKAYYDPSSSKWQAFQQQAQSAGYEKLNVTLMDSNGVPYVPSNGFSAQAWINRQTGEVVVAYRGTDELREFIGPDAAALQGRWHAQFDDAGRFAVAARTAGGQLLAVYAEQQGLTTAPPVTLITTGHSLGGMLAQVASSLTGAEGRAFDAPGVMALTQTDGFRALAQSLGEPADGHAIGDQQFVSYQTGLVGNLGGIPVGSQANIMALNAPSLTPLLVGVGIGVVIPVLGIGIAASGSAIIDTHGMTGIERAAHGLVALQTQLGTGQLQLVEMPLDQASGQPWTLEGTVPISKVILDAQGNILYWAEWQQQLPPDDPDNYNFPPYIPSIPANLLYPGATEVQGAAAQHKLADPAAPTFHPIVLDFNGDNLINTLGSQAVAFDTDGSGYLRHTDWVAANANGQADAFLVLDRNFNGRADTGEDLFSNGKVDASIQGVPSLFWVDANRDGVIDEADPVFDQLHVWQDRNGNGRFDAGDTVVEAANERRFAWVA